ncbi:OmpA family protein [Pseudomonas mangiferae]|uniref:OmpA family protein n=1 Tax=Pseudomonas mangiferae TaxID=2593654 RepID=A0A553H1D2_9PSED|nr:OmpA family protein [Pseudomonas mangiferae]TRX75531.1 OmpA family protein [Pseudomonas mangiferae]
MNKFIAIPVLSALSLAMVACASKPNPNLEQARSNYSTLQSQPQANSLAALETKEAGDMLNRAEQAYRDKQDASHVDQLAYLTNQRVQVAQETIRLRTAESDLRNAASQRTQAQLDARTQQMNILKNELQNLKPQQTDRGSVITLGDMLFEVDRAELKRSGLANVQQLATFLNQHPERLVVVEGFTDSTGTVEHNLRLSQARADSVRRALVSMGVSPQRITTQGFGKDYPVADNATASNRALNRRVEVTVSNGPEPVAPRGPRVLQ